MANKVLVLVDGKAVTVEGSANGQVLTWSEDNNQATFETGGGGSGTVTSVGLTGGTSGIVIGGTTSPITTSGTYNLDAPLKFSWNTATPAAVANPGDVAWNADAGSLNLMFGLGTVTGVLGQTIHQRVKNDTGVQLDKGAVVYVTGADGQRPTVALAQADADSTSATILGIVAANIADGDEGYVITEGPIIGLNTNSFTAGDVLYLSPTTPGALINVKPAAPQHLVMVGYCLKVNSSSGEVLVKTQNGYEIGELHDVYTSSEASGQMLVYNADVGVTRWQNVTMSGDATLSKTGELTLATVPVTKGGTGLTSIVSGRILYASGTNTLSAGTLSNLDWSAITPVSNIDISPTFVTSGTGRSAVFRGGFTNSGTGGELLLRGGITLDGTGGSVVIRGGEGTVANGTLNLGTTTTSAVNVGATGVTTTINGTLTLETDLAPAHGGTGLGAPAAGDAGKALVPKADGTYELASPTLGIPYDLPAEIPGTPPVSTRVVNFIAVRPFRLASSGHQGGALEWPTTDDFVCTVSRDEGAGPVSIGTLTFSTLGTFSSSITQTDFAAGDVLVVETPAADEGIYTPFFTLAMTLL